MKKRYHIYNAIIISLLSSCNFFQKTSINVNRPQSTISYDFAEKENEFYDGYYKANDIKYTIKSANEQLGWHSLSSLGNQNILVVPVQLNNGPQWTKPMLENLYSVFFGESNETNWESVHSFFYKSSYGQLNIIGEVYQTPIIINKYSTRGFDNSYKLGIDEPGNIVANTFYKDAPSELLQKYDQDKDGFIDAIVFCYSNDFSEDSDSVYWAWVDYNLQNRPITNKPNINTFMWASYSFIKEKYYGIFNVPQGLDAHTFIHETGHLLGLDDYYNYDYDWDPAGTLDMQSYNVGDHNIYSKMALGWIKPYVVTNNSTITLRNSAKYADAILIKNNWNGSLFDEYLLIEYYAPEELNKQDALFIYSNRDRMYNYYGLRIYHVDARLVSNVKSFYEEDGTITRLNSGYTSDFNSTRCYIGAANSPLSWSYLNSNDRMYFYYLHLLDSAKQNVLNEGTLTMSTTLWKKGSTFNPNNCQGFFKNKTKFNDNTPINFNISVSNITEENATITVTKTTN